MHPVNIDNGSVAMEVWPQFGGKVSSIVDKADGYELLFTYPAELPDSPKYDVNYGSGWYAGWDECFPAISQGAYVGHPYDGIRVPDHGELWGMPVTAVPAKDGITTVWQGLRFGYRLTRKLYLDGPSIVAEYTLINLAPFPFRYVWALHSLMNLTAPCVLEGTAGAGYRVRHDYVGPDAEPEAIRWPRLGDGTDLSNPSVLPGRRSWKVFSQDAISQAFVVRYPGRGRSLRIEYAAEEQPAYWGIWINTGKWAGHHHFAVEPTTGRNDELDKSVRDGSAAAVPGNGRRDWTVRWTLS